MNKYDIIIYIILHCNQISRFQAEASNFPKPYSPATISTSNGTSLFGFPTFKIGGGGYVHHPKWYHTRGGRTGFLVSRLLV